MVLEKLSRVALTLLQVPLGSFCYRFPVALQGKCPPGTSRNDVMVLPWKPSKDHSDMAKGTCLLLYSLDWRCCLNFHCLFPFLGSMWERNTSIGSDDGHRSHLLPHCCPCWFGALISWLGREYTACGNCTSRLSMHRDQSSYIFFSTLINIFDYSTFETRLIQADFGQLKKVLKLYERIQKEPLCSRGEWWVEQWDNGLEAINLTHIWVHRKYKAILLQGESCSQ